MDDIMECLGEVGIIIPPLSSMGEPYDYPGISFPIHTNSNIDITETYAYTLDGRLKSLSSDVFSMELRSDKPVLANTLADYSGRITELSWCNNLSLIPEMHEYAFTYDKWGQLANSTYYHNESQADRFYEGGMTYDANGNITTLARYGNSSVPIDWLEYNYDGNKLMMIGDEGGYFAYDNNGNMTVDGRSDWKYEYNSLDLLEKAYDEDDNELAAYTWLASGQKVGVADPAGNGFVYLGSLQYVLRDGELSLESTGFGGGRIVACETTGGIAYEPLYFIRDHLGSIRAIVSGGTDGCNVVYNNYYPFGGRWSDTGEATTGRWLYNGKELQTTGGLGHLLDYGSRMYDPSLGRWFNTDPRSQFTSPYVFGANSPMIGVDPDGEFWHIVIGAAIGGVANLAANWGNIDGFWDGLVTFSVGAGAGAVTALTGNASLGYAVLAAGASAAVTGASNDIVRQTGKNFDGLKNINWQETGQASLVSGIAGAAGSVVGTWAGNSKVLVNNINSPILRSMIVAPISSGAAHIAAGTTTGLINGDNLHIAFHNSLEGIEMSIVLGTTLSVTTTIGVSYANNINPWNGKYSANNSVATALGLDETWERIQVGESYPHRNDGSVFQNKEGFLPAKDLGYYREFVHPTSGVPGPGLQRIIIGAMGEVYYSPDHYLINIYRIR